VSHWRATPSRVRPLAIFDTERSKVQGWQEIPTAKEAMGADINYLMLRGIFGPPSMPKDAMAWYQGFLQKVMDTPEWKDFMVKGAFKQAWSTGPELTKWLEGAEQLHKDLMSKGGLLKQ
jgi:tripartite-type tricarboxylate transporter receptor subunit TctC